MEERKKLLTINAVTSNYGPISALEGISLNVLRGEINVVLGANGAGKSTLLWTIMGLLHPSEGSIFFNQVPIHRMPTEKIVRLGLCLVPEGRRIFPELTVLENLRMGAYIRNDRLDIKKDIKEVESRFPVLAIRRSQLAGNLSGGEQQMLAIGRALMGKPKLLLLDEPSMGLAPLIVDEIFSMIRVINRESTTVLLVEQNAIAALEIAARGFIIESGTISLSGTAQELLDSEKVKQAYMGG